ncbi:MAG: Gfo/Idh/MocA family oxidoreductase [Deltaproteobacteria bacterium]|nr:Gfo/Idh/MocA family oxidoreductase [Deltaproteobacteria bacterium]
MLVSDPNLQQRVKDLTEGFGVDGVIVTARARSNDPINLAGRLVRKRGKIVVVGEVGHGFDRAVFYEKELSILMSCSYGAGRYDPVYERQGIDYPRAYVDWTVERNMKTFLWLLSTGRIRVGHMISRVFSIDEAQGAYDLLLEKRPDTLALLFGYREEGMRDLKALRVVEAGPEQAVRRRGPHIGLIGFGNYAKSHIVPNMSRNLRITALAARSPSSLRFRKRGALADCRVVTTDPQVILENEEIRTIVVATRHSTHSLFLLEGLERGKNVYVEKPMVAKEEELTLLAGMLRTHGGNVCVGFNRRYSPAVRKLQERIHGSPLESRYTVAADPFPEDYWALEEGEGGIIVGEIIHFVDILCVLHGSRVARVFATSNLKAVNRGSIHITLSFENGSTGVISYVMGSSARSSKEEVELVYPDDRVLIHGFRRVISSRYGSIYRSLSPDMGRKRLFGHILEAFSSGVKVQETEGLLNSHAAVFAARRSIQSGNAEQVEYA